MHRSGRVHAYAYVCTGGRDAPELSKGAAGLAVVPLAHAHMHVRMCTHVHACARMCMHVHACACMCTHVHACACMYTHSSSALPPGWR